MKKGKSSFFLLQRVSCEGRGLTPLYILQVTLAGPRTTVEAQAVQKLLLRTARSLDSYDAGFK